MKKIVITLGILVLIAAALPIIGNSFMESTIDTRVQELDSYGLKSKNTQSDSSYLTTKKHFEFLLENSDEFVAYLNQYADQQIPPYVNAMFEGVVIGADLEYSNLPFSKDITLDIYPLSVSPAMANNLQKEDMKFYTYLEKFLHSKGVLYHINYNILSEDFNGFIKDIDETYSLDDGTVLKLLLKNTVFEGNGELVAPNRLVTKLKDLRMYINKGQENFLFNINNLQTSTLYESKSTYVNSVNLEDINISVDGTSDDMSFEMKNIKVNASSNTQGEFAELDSKSSVASMRLNSREIMLDMQEFNIDIAVDALDKASFEESLTLLSKIRNTNDAAAQDKLLKVASELMSKGFVFNIADFSMQNIRFNDHKDLKGFKLKSKTTFKADKDFAQKLQLSPILLIQNIENLTNIRVSKEIYARLTQERPLPPQMLQYVKEDANDYVFDISYLHGEAKINGKLLQ